MKRQTISPKRDPEVEANVQLVMFGYLKGFEDGMLGGLIRYIRELQKRDLIPQEKTGEAIKAVLDDYSFGGFDYGEIAPKIAEFYQDKRNSGILFPHSVLFIVRQLKGTIDDAQAEIELKELRFQFPAKGESQQ